MLDRAQKRGEWAPSAFEVIDYLLAPLYVHGLFGATGDNGVVECLIDRLHTLPMIAELPI